MNFYRLLSFFYPSLQWSIKTEKKHLYLTFDDGPVPEVTPWVLDQLEKFNAKATFFCIGKNVEQHRDIYKQLAEKGHRIGNHTYSHYNAWKVKADLYLQDTQRASAVISSDLFRPPYGKITTSLITKLKSSYRIIMWDVLSYDFDTTRNSEFCTSHVLQNTRPGSIIVFHDSIKAAPRLKESLPEILTHFSKDGYQFLPLP